MRSVRNVEQNEDHFNPRMPVEFSTNYVSWKSTSCAKEWPVGKFLSVGIVKEK